MSARNKKETFILIMPAYNEKENIESTIRSWIPIINSYQGSEILVINDGSTDGTKDKLDSLSKKVKRLKVLHKKNEGHGKTILLGYQIAADSPHTWVFQTDSDGHFDPSDFNKLWEKRDTSPFILGYRQKRKDSLDRLIISQLASIWILILFGKHIKDPNIPFRLMKKDYLKKILKKVPGGVFAPNIFLSVLAACDNCDLQHIPVKHKARKNSFSKAKLLKGSFKDFFELLRFRI